MLKYNQYLETNETMYGNNHYEVFWKIARLKRSREIFYFVTLLKMS